jgi:hypothetical protein
MFLACQKSKVTIKLKFYYSNLKNAVETAKIAIDSCYVPRQFLTPLPSIDFREIRGLVTTTPQECDPNGYPDNSKNRDRDLPIMGKIVQKLCSTVFRSQNIGSPVLFDWYSTTFVRCQCFDKHGRLDNKTILKTISLFQNSLVARL